MHHGLFATESTSVAIGKGTRSGLCGITYVNAMATESILGDDRKVLAYHYHLCWRRYHASPGVGRGHMTCALAQKNGGGGVGSVPADPLTVASAPGAFPLARRSPVP